MLEPGEVIARTEEYVRSALAGDRTGHDWWHVDRVRRLALRLGRDEGADEFVVELAALLHDLDDAKFSNSETASAAAAAAWLETLELDKQLVDDVVSIIAGVSFAGEATPDQALSIEGECVRDADRLDALGAIGIGRAFAYGGFSGRDMHNPHVGPHSGMTRSVYRSTESTTINHFYEKLLLLRERMATSTGRRLAEQRHQKTKAFLDEFLKEWNGAD